LTTERANPLRRWNSDWGRRSTARRPVAAVETLFLRRSDFVNRPNYFEFRSGVEVESCEVVELIELSF
jgi:hypothetical protein